MAYPAATGRERDHRRGQLEAEDRRELHSSRSSSTQERIADTDIAGSSDRVGARADLPIIAVGRKARLAGIGDESRKEGIREIRMIQDVEEFSTDLHIHAFAERCVFVDGKIPLLEGGPSKFVTPLIAEVTGSRDAILFGVG